MSTRRQRAARAREARAPLLVSAGAVALLCSLPLLYVLVRAAGAGAGTWAALLDRRVPGLLVNTIGLALVVVAATLAIGAGLAYLVVRTDLPARRALSVLCALPLAIPPYVGAVVYADVLGPRGALRDALGVEELPSIFGFAGAAFVLVLFTYPYVFLLASGALRALDPSLEEAARGLGRGGIVALALTTLRMTAPALGGGSLLVGLYVLSDFGAVSLMRFDTFTTVIYEELGGRFDPAGAAALSSVLVALTLLLLGAGRWLRRGGGYAQAGGGRARESVRELGLARWPLLVGVCAVLGAALVLPLVRLGSWSVATFGEEDLAEYGGWAANSLLVSTLAAGAAVIMALPVAVLLAGERARAGVPDRTARVLGWLAQAGYALPGVIVALALVAITTRFVEPLYGTLALLVAAFVIRFLPQAIQGEQAGLTLVAASLGEAARGLGAGRAAAFARVVLPLLRPSVAVSFAVVFLTAVKELPATLVLRPLGFDTLPVRVWTEARNGLSADAGPAALMLVLVSIVPLYVLLSRPSGGEPPPL